MELYGKSEKIYHKDSKVPLIDCAVPLNDIKNFDTLFFRQSMKLYNNFILFKNSPPLGNGFANERITTSLILSILTDESYKYDKWEREMNKT